MLKTKKVGYLAAAVVLIVIGLISKIFGSGAGADAAQAAQTTSSADNFIPCILLGLVSVLLFFLMNVKFDQEAKEAITDISEKGKIFSKKLPLSFIGNLSFTWVIIVVAAQLLQVVSKIASLPIPPFVLSLLTNIGILFFMISAFYNAFGGNIKQLGLSSAIFAILQLLEFCVTFFTKNRQVVFANIINFLVFWTLFNIASVYSKSKVSAADQNEDNEEDEEEDEEDENIDEESSEE